MGSYTTRAGLYKPGGGSTGQITPDEVADIDKINGNSDIIDLLLGARNIPSASSYAGTFDGDLVYTRDTGILHMYSATEGKLVVPKFPGASRFIGTKAQRDAYTSPTLGDSWYDVDDTYTYVWRGATPKWERDDHRPFTSFGLTRWGSRFPLSWRHDRGGIHIYGAAIGVAAAGIVNIPEAIRPKDQVRLVDRSSDGPTRAATITAAGVFAVPGATGTVTVFFDDWYPLTDAP